MKQDTTETIETHDTYGIAPVSAGKCAFVTLIEMDYTALAKELTALLEGEYDLVANAANTAALLYRNLPEINWAGFYLLKGGELVLGPFQGKPACIRIAMGKGVCGTAAAKRETLMVDDVELFPGHIACDADSRSEMVVPLLRNNRLLGVLDLDSPRKGRFEECDARGCEMLMDIFLQHVMV